jgi:hypothetical protein
MRPIPLLVASLALLAALPLHATDVMILGTYHMANPGRDLHNLKSDDVLAPKRQAELAAVADGLARFKPTLVAVESAAEKGVPTPVAHYREYLDGGLAESRNETVQVGFRLAKKVGLEQVWGIDVDGDFPFEAVQAFADDGRPELKAKLEELGAGIERSLRELGAVLENGSIGQGLRLTNDPRRLLRDNAFYFEMLRFGAGDRQPGATLLSSWQARNNAICARLVQIAGPQDRVVVLYGSGHAFLLRQCVAQMPGYRLVEPNDYLPM